MNTTDQPVAATDTQAVKVLDSRGREIVKGSIVTGIESDQCWSMFQGLVLHPESPFAEEDFSVAVFFDKEMNGSYFYKPSRGGRTIYNWDDEFKGKKKYAEIIPTWDHEKQMDCPRVVLSRPSELIVQPNWRIETLANRCEPGQRYWSRSVFTFPLIKGAHACHVEGCEGMAEHITMVNFWGNMIPYYACTKCHHKYNGFRMETPPERKKELPAPPQEQIANFEAEWGVVKI